MKIFLGLLFFLGGVFVIQAQRKCGTVNYNAEWNSILNRPAGSTINDTFLNQIINIPVVVHIVYNTPDQNISDSQILSQITVLNQDYNRQNEDTILTPDAFKPFAGNAKIVFCLAKINPHGKNTNGILHVYTGQQFFTTDDAVKYSAQGGDDSWDCTKYLNIWVCNLASTSLGYGTFPGGPPDRDGVVIGYNVFGTIGNLRTPFNKGRTATHEIGHWLGLKHTWGDTDCGDDSIADTPQQEAYNFGCPPFPHLSTCSPNANGDMFMDFMDFTDDGCMNMFTIDQVKEMKTLFAANNARNSFLKAYQCDSLLIQAAPLPVNSSDNDTIATKEIVSFFPNPVHTQLTINLNSFSLTQQTLRIYNVVGIQVFSMQINQPNITINLSAFAPGIYILKAGEGNNIFTAKIIRN